MKHLSNQRNNGKDNVNIYTQWVFISLKVKQKQQQSNNNSNKNTWVTKIFWPYYISLMSLRLWRDSLCDVLWKVWTQREEISATL